MEKQAYLNELSGLLAVNVESLTDDFSLRNHHLWDSLSIVSTIASIDSYYHVSMKGEELEQCDSVGDIFKRIKEKLTLKK